MKEKENLKFLSEQKSFKEFLNEAYNFFKNNKQLFFLGPTITGGVIQLIYLLSIDFKFVRFFSISQLLADGIVFFLFFIFVFASYKIIQYLILHLIIFINARRKRKDSFEWINYIFFAIYIIKEFLDFVSKKSILNGLFNTVCFLGFVISFNFFFKFQPKGKVVSKVIFVLTAIVFSIYFLSGFFYYANRLNSPFFLNYINVMTIVEDSFPEKKDSEIMYYNDKYIFVKIITEKNGKEDEDFHVFKQDVFFKDFSQAKLINKMINNGKVLEKKDSIYKSKIDSLNIIINELREKDK